MSAKLCDQYHCEPQVSEMSEMITLKTGVKSAISLYMGEKITQGSCVQITMMEVNDRETLIKCLPAHSMI